MSQCQRCGAGNEPSSRFCVACGSPLIGRSNPAASPAQPTAAPPPFQSPEPPAPAVVHPYEGVPVSSSLQYAETAAPPTGDEFEAARAAAAQERTASPVNPVPSYAPPPGAQQSSSAPPGYRPSAPPMSFAATAASATAAMPGMVAQDPEAVPEGAPRILAGFLVSYDVHAVGRAWPIFQGANRIGREGAGVPLDLELDHPTASSRHAVILASACPGRMKLEDTGSTNGTMLNGARLASGTRHEIRDGDRIRFGLLSTIIKII